MKLLFIGPDVPPVSGYGNIVSATRRMFEEHSDLDVYFFSTTPASLAFTFPSSFWRVSRMFFYMGKIFSLPLRLLFFDAIYLNLNGDRAQVLDLFVVFFARIFRVRVFFHHHSFAYLKTESRVSSFLFRAAGFKATHFVNCSCMCIHLTRTYRLANQVNIISNADIMRLGDDKSTSGRLHDESRVFDGVTVAFVGYLTADKGIGLFCELIERLHNTEGVAVRAIAVGPSHDENFTSRLYEEHGDHVEFLGPLYGDAFERLLREIDILVFPSMYTAEAEPLTVHAALRNGVPVLATDVGCLAEILADIPHCKCFSVDEFRSAGFEALLALTESFSIMAADIHNDVYHAYLGWMKGSSGRIERYIAEVSKSE